ncbi:SoxR reducing system RseC family protein [Variovorax sp. JS1663]|uniref:SoxR reducing system RseC family protein n=1 Tax=Variovorax sp. JS1663 TaxID=1851577 RepID=UPI00117EC463|nr:SoxR reducing system RseC family protein [Variovorax sp. JS1663]
MSFALYLLGFVIFLAGLAWGASVAGVPTLYIGIGALILLGIGIFSAVGRTRSKDPS